MQCTQCTLFLLVQCTIFIKLSTMHHQTVSAMYTIHVSAMYTIYLTGDSASWKLNMRDAHCENVMYYNSTRGTIQALTMQATHSLSV